MYMKQTFSRKFFLKTGLFSGAAALAGSLITGNASPDLSQDVKQQKKEDPPHKPEPHGGMSAVGRVDHKRNGFDPHEILTDWDTGKVSQLPNGQTLREYQFVAIDKEVEIAPGVFFPAWTYNGRIPGPTIRCTEGDRIRVHFTNAGSHPHTIHFHGIHSAEMDGVPGSGPAM